MLMNYMMMNYMMMNCKFFPTLSDEQQLPALYGMLIGVFTALKAFLCMYYPSPAYAWDPALKQVNNPAFSQAWFSGGVGFAVASTTPNFKYHAMAMLLACGYGVKLHLGGTDPFSKSTLINMLYYPYGIMAVNIYFAFFHDYGDNTCVATE